MIIAVLELKCKVKTKGTKESQNLAALLAVGLQKSVKNGPCHVHRTDWSKDNRPCREFSTPLSKTEAVYFTGKKIPEAEQTAHILLVRLGKEGLRRFSSWALPEEQQTPAVGRFKEQLKPQCRKFRIAGLKLMAAYRQGAAYESLDDFVNRCKSAGVEMRLHSKRTLAGLVIASCRDFNFQKNLLSQGPGFSLEEALRLGRTYEAKAASHIQ